MGPRALADTVNESPGTTDTACPVTWSHSDSPGSTDTATVEPVTSDPGPRRTAWADADPAAGPPPYERATRSPSDAASWATWVACVHRQNCTMTMSRTISTGTTMTASTTVDPSSVQPRFNRRDARLSSG